MYGRLVPQAPPAQQYTTTAGPNVISIAAVGAVGSIRTKSYNARRHLP